MTNDIIKHENTPVGPDEDWNRIVDRLVGELREQELPDNVVRATEYLLAGWPIYKTAKKVHASSQTIRKWISQYPTMAAVLHAGRVLLSKWRMSKLEQQFLTAVERSQEVLELGLDGSYYDEETGDDKTANPKVLPVIAAQARYIIGLFSGQQISVKVEHELGETVLKAQRDALDYLAEKLREQNDGADEEPIEAVYRVIDAKVDASGPYLDENGNPPFGELGKLDRNEEGALCFICGSRFKDLPKHLNTRHNTNVSEYETLYMLPPGSLRKVEDDEEVGW